MWTIPRLPVERATVLVCIYATIHFLYAYWIHPYNPLQRVGIDAGWNGWADQAVYLRIAEYMARGELAPGFFYPPGYSLLAVPFVSIFPLIPFLIPNLILFVVTSVLYFRLACKFLAPELSLLAIVLLSQDDQFLAFFVEPWSNAVTACCMAVLLALVGMPPRQARHAWLAAGGVGLCMALTLAARYGDVLFLAPVALAALVRLAPTWKKRFLLAVVAGLVALPMVVWVGWIHNTIYGSPFTTPYTLHMSRLTGHQSQGMESRSLTYVGTHLFSLLINPQTFDTAAKFPVGRHSIDHRPLLSYYFVIIFAVTGLAFMQRRQRLLVGAFAASLALGLLYYGTFWSTSAHDLRVFALRFFAAWQPMLVCAAVIGLVSLLYANWQTWADRRLIGASLLLPVFFGVGLYTWGNVFPPFPDWARALPTQGWRVSASVASEQAGRAVDKTVIRGWHAEGVQPAGTTFTLDMGRPYVTEQVFLVRRAGSASEVVSVTVHMSRDGMRWFVPAGLQQNTFEGRITAFQFAPTETQYIRLVLLADSGPTGWSIDELVVYGDVPSVVALPDEGWYGEERSDLHNYRWIRSPARIQLLATESQPALLAFEAVNAVRPESTVEIRTDREVLARFQVAAGRKMRIGPISVPRGMSYVRLHVLEENQPQSVLGTTERSRPVNLALTRLRILPVTPP